MSEEFGNPHEISRNWLYVYRLHNALAKYLCNFTEPKLSDLQEFAKSRGLGSLDVHVDDWRKISRTKTDEELAPLFSLSQVIAGEKKKQAAKFEKLISDALEHRAADVVFDPPDAATDRNLVFGSDHRVVKASDPLESRTMHDLGNANIAEQDNDDDVMFSLHESKEDMDVQEVHTNTLQEQTEARKEEVLAGIPTTAWQAAKERVTRHEEALYATPQESLAGIAKIRERFWGWLLHDRPEELLTKASVSESALQEALEQWGITELNFLNMMEVHQEQVRKEHEAEVQQVYATSMLAHLCHCQSQE